MMTRLLNQMRDLKYEGTQFVGLNVAQERDGSR
jgi:hypothetical protein